MNPLCIAVLDRDTLADRPFDFDFPHTLNSYGSTEAHQTAERIQGADIIITNKVVISAEHIAANPQLKLIALAATGVNRVYDDDYPDAQPACLSARRCGGLVGKLAVFLPPRRTDARFKR